MSGLLIRERWVAVFPSLVRAFGSIETAVILQVLHFHAMDSMVRITSQQISDETGIAERTVRRRLAWLRENDVISNEGRASAFDPTLTFQINYEHATLSTRDCHADRQSGQNGRHSSIKNEVRTNTTPSPAVTPHDFDAWWSLYPRKVGRPAAIKAYGQAMEKGVTPDALLAALRQQVPSLGKNLRYCPHPSTWLNQERWTDTADTAKPSPQEPNLKAFR